MKSTRIRAVACALCAALGIIANGGSGPSAVEQAVDAAVATRGDSQATVDLLALLRENPAVAVDELERISLNATNPPPHRLLAATLLCASQEHAKARNVLLQLTQDSDPTVADLGLAILAGSQYTGAEVTVAFRRAVQTGIPGRKTGRVRFDAWSQPTGQIRVSGRIRYWPSHGS